jgi:inorganic pyrophosphatase
MPSRRVLQLGWALAAWSGCAPAPAPEPTTPVEARYAELPPHAERRLRESLDAARSHATHVWRDTAPLDESGTLTGYVEIPLGERTKWELDIAANRLAVDRVMSESVGGYPVNYGYVPQTISFDGDPFDVLVLGPSLAPGQLVRGHIVGILYMDDEKGPDMKVVISPVGSRHALTDADKARIGAFFDVYKKPEQAAGKWSKVLGWGSAAEGRQWVDATHRFFEQGQARP